MKSFDSHQLYLAILKCVAPSYLNQDQRVNAKVVFANTLLTLTKISTFLYYVLDNLMWIASVGMIPDRIFNRERWKFWKKVLNLVKNYTQLVRAYLLYLLNSRKLEKIEFELSQFDSQVCGHMNYEATETMRRYIMQHSEVYDQMFVLTRNTIRIMMLNYKLKIFFWKDVFHPILISFMGIVQNITTLFKIWLKKRYNSFSGKIIRVKDFMILLPRMEEFSRREQGQELSSESNSL